MVIESTLADTSSRTEDPAGLERDATLALCRALGDPTRLDLMASIWAGEKCVCDLQASVGGKAQNLVSHHLSALREAGLVEPRRQGRWVYYRPADRMSLAVATALALLIGPRGSLNSSCF